MSTDKLIGSRLVRITTVVVGGLAILGLAVFWNGTGRVAGWGRTAAVACAFVALLGCIHCTRAGYEVWMRFAKLLSDVMKTVVFGLCYLVLVPLFVPIVWLLDPLRLRRDGVAQSYWHHRSDTPVDAEMLRRMG